MGIKFHKRGRVTKKSKFEENLAARKIMECMGLKISPVFALKA
jgi:hypothetical protein